MSNLHINNHYIPKCYLKRWEDSNHQICVYKTLVNHESVPLWKKYFSTAIAYHKHLYTHVVAGKESDELEKWFDSKYESPGNIVLEKVLLNQKLTVKDWNILVNFLAVQDVRTPSRLYAHLQHCKEFLPEILKSTLQKLNNKLENEKSIDVADHEALVQNTSTFPLKVTTIPFSSLKGGLLKVETYSGRGSWIYSIKYVLENISKILHSYKWSIVKPAKGFKWLTCDNPVVRLNFRDYQDYDLKGGWGNNKGNIFFPISPDHAMFVQIGDKPYPKGTILTVDQTMFFRKIVIENANRLIFADTIDDDVIKICPRTVDSNKFKNEQIQLANWHEFNKQLELEYYK